MSSLLVLAVVQGLTSSVDQYGNIDWYEFDSFILLAFATLDIAAICASGTIGRVSASAMASSQLLLLAGLAYLVSVAVRHPGQIDVLDPLLGGIVAIALGFAGFLGIVVLLGGLLGAGASTVLLGCRWLRNSAWPRLGARL